MNKRVVKFLEQNKIIEENQARLDMVNSQEKINVCSYQPRKGIWFHRDTEQIIRVLNKIGMEEKI